jgi:branched-chain amino acid transport system permease protein
MIMDNLQRLIWGVQPIFAAEPLKLLPNISVFMVSIPSYQVLLLPGVALATLFRPALLPAAYARRRP